MKLSHLDRVAPKILLALCAVPCLALAAIVTGIDADIGRLTPTCAHADLATGCRPATATFARHFLQHAAILTLPILGPLAGWALWTGWQDRVRQRRARRLGHSAQDRRLA